MLSPKRLAFAALALAAGALPSDAQGRCPMSCFLDDSSPSDELEARCISRSFDGFSCNYCPAVPFGSPRGTLLDGVALCMPDLPEDCSLYIGDDDNDFTVVIPARQCGYLVQGDQTDPAATPYPEPRGADDDGDNPFETESEPRGMQLLKKVILPAFPFLIIISSSLFAIVKRRGKNEWAAERVKMRTGVLEGRSSARRPPWFERVIVAFEPNWNMVPISQREFAALNQSTSSGVNWVRYMVWRRWAFVTLLAFEIVMFATSVWDLVPNLQFDDSAETYLTPQYRNLVLALYGIDLAANIVRIFSFALACVWWDKWRRTKYCVLVGWLSQFFILVVGLVPIRRLRIVERETIIRALDAEVSDPAVQDALTLYEDAIQLQTIYQLAAMVLLRILPVFVTILPSIANAASHLKTLRPLVSPFGIVIQVAVSAQGILAASFGVIAIQLTNGNGWIYTGIFAYLGSMGTMAVVGHILTDPFSSSFAALEAVLWPSLSSTVLLLVSAVSFTTWAFIEFVTVDGFDLAITAINIVLLTPGKLILGTMFLADIGSNAALGDRDQVLYGLDPKAPRELKSMASTADTGGEENESAGEDDNNRA